MELSKSSESDFLESPYNLILPVNKKENVPAQGFSSLGRETLDENILNHLPLSCMLKLFIFSYCPVFRIILIFELYSSLNCDSKFFFLYQK